MSDTPLREIDTGKARNQLGTPSFADGKKIHAYDTETSDGDIFAIGMFTDGDDYRAKFDSDGIDGLEVLEFITQGEARSALNVWYNLNFDVNVILKALPRENLEDIRFHNRTEWEDENGKEWSITYIPKKMLEIRDGNGNAYSHFDVSQFCYTSLEGAAEDWLGIEDGKANDGLDVERFGEKSYIEAHEGEIRRYLREDCRLTRDIFREVVTLGEDLNIPFGKPYSTGYVAADYVRNRLEYKPGYGPAWLQEVAWETYRGGRFEVAKRGDVGRVYGADINSAYPWVLSELPDPATVKWGGFGEAGVNPIEAADFEEADYGFVKATMSTDPERPFQPFAITNPDEGGRVEYPALQNVTKWVLLDEFVFARDNDFFTDYDVHGAVLGLTSEDTVYPFDFFKDIYHERKTLEDDGKMKHGKLLKIVMNSIYGKTCQTNVNYEEIDETTAFEEVAGSVATDHRGRAFYENEVAGRLFNPFLATYITGRTRLKLLESVVENGLEDDTIMLATDCIMVEAEAFEGTDLHTAAEAEAPSYREALGGWDYDYVGEAFVIGSGVYEVETEDGKLKSGVRGFKDLYSDENDFDSIREAAEAHPDGIPVKNHRPVTMGDILARGGKLSEIGSFTKTERKLTASMDTKRNWPRGETVTFADLLTGAEGSKPKVLNGAKAEMETLKWEGDNE